MGDLCGFSIINSCMFLEKIICLQPSGYLVDGTSFPLIPWLLKSSQKLWPCDQNCMRFEYPPHQWHHFASKGIRFLQTSVGPICKMRIDRGSTWLGCGEDSICLYSSHPTLLQNRFPKPEFQNTGRGRRLRDDHSNLSFSASQTARDCQWGTGRWKRPQDKCGTILLHFKCTEIKLTNFDVTYAYATSGNVFCVTQS